MPKTQREIVTEEQALSSMVQSMYDGFASMRQLTEVLEEKLPQALENIARQAELVIKSSSEVELSEDRLKEIAERLIEVHNHTAQLKSYIAEMEETIISQGHILSELMLVKDNPLAVTELLGSISTIIVNFDQYLSSSERIVARALYLAHPSTKSAAIKLLSPTVIAEWQALFAEASRQIIKGESEDTSS